MVYKRERDRDISWCKGLYLPDKDLRKDKVTRTKILYTVKDYHIQSKETGEKGFYRINKYFKLRR